MSSSSSLLVLVCTGKKEEEEGGGTKEARRCNHCDKVEGPATSLSCVVFSFGPGPLF